MEQTVVEGVKEEEQLILAKIRESWYFVAYLSNYNLIITSPHLSPTSFYLLLDFWDKNIAYAQKY